MFETFEFINEDFPWFFSILAAVFGAMTGSFLNVCIYRIPEGRSIVFPGSTCACGRPIPFYHNIPILTWLILRGKASCCGAPFSVRYPAVELLTAVLFLWVWTIYPPVVALLGMLFVAFLICSTFIDLDHMIIPDRFSIGGMVIGVILSFIFPSLHGVDGLPIVSNIQSGVSAIVGALVGAGLVYWIAVLGEIVFRKPAMGEGDVKFVGFIGAFFGGLIKAAVSRQREYLALRADVSCCRIDLFPWLRCLCGCLFHRICQLLPYTLSNLTFMIHFEY